MTEQFRPQPENQKQHAPQVRDESRGIPDRQPRPQSYDKDSKSPELASQLPQKKSPVDNPTTEKKIEQVRLTKQPRAIFDNCIVSSLMPSVSQVEERLVKGSITKERALQIKEAALRRQRWYEIGEMFEEGRITRDEYIRLRKELSRFSKAEK